MHATLPIFCTTSSSKYRNRDVFVMSSILICRLYVLQCNCLIFIFSLLINILCVYQIKRCEEDIKLIASRLFASDDGELLEDFSELFILWSVYQDWNFWIKFVNKVRGIFCITFFISSQNDDFIKYFKENHSKPLNNHQSWIIQKK